MAGKESKETVSGKPAVIGLTGGIGAGKSIVARILRLNGFPVYDCDSEARRLMNGKESVRARLIEVLGERCYAPEGCLDRRFVAEKLFGDSGMRKIVNGIVHAEVKDDFISFASQSRCPVVFCESAILASSGLSGICNRVWVVEAPENERLGRVGRRNGLAESEIRSRMKSQENELGLLDGFPVDFLNNDGQRPVVGRVVELLEGMGLMESECRQEIEFIAGKDDDLRNTEK